MADPHDYDLLKTEELRDPEAPARPRVWIGVVLLVVVAALVGYFVYARRPVPAPATPAAKVVEPEQPVRPLGGDADRVAVPPLDESDPIVRQLVRTITSHPAALAWLTTNGLIRNFTVVVSNVVEGITPAKHLRALRPSSAFRVVDRDHKLFIDARGYERYNGVADAVASIDPVGASRLYATLKPRIQEAYGQLGLPPNSFDRALETAIVSLLQAPAIADPVRVEPKGIGYRYADPNLESLTGAQKHLLRTGPRNVRVIQTALGQLAIALGIPPGRLPSARQ